MIATISYFLTTRGVVQAVAKFAGGSDVQRLIVIPYIAAGVAACLAAMFDRDPSGALAGRCAKRL
jgi:hypothetical protein